MDETHGSHAPNLAAKAEGMVADLEAQGVVNTEQNHHIQPDKSATGPNGVSHEPEDRGFWRIVRNFTPS
jgi:hypothetical protein